LHKKSAIYPSLNKKLPPGKKQKEDFKKERFFFFFPKFFIGFFIEKNDK
jgi:hypothetical protein